MRVGKTVGIIGLGVAQTVGWASSYYLPAILSEAMARAVGVPVVWIYAAFSAAMALSALVGPWAGGRIDRFGGRRILALSNLVFALGLAVLALSPHAGFLFAGWAIMGLAMGMGLYEAAFAALTWTYGRGARGPITAVTLIAGFASTVGWPLTGWMLEHWGWREACLGWAGLHLALALPLNALLPLRPGAGDGAPSGPDHAPASQGPRGSPGGVATGLLAFVFAVTWFNSTAMATHLPALLQSVGATPAAALAAGALIGPAQVLARLMEFGLLRRVHPLVSARLAAAAYPAAAACLMVFGAPAASLFALLHGAGNGILTIAKGTLPLALFGPHGYGARLGWLNAPARIMQAAAPLAFGAALQMWGAAALWLTATLGLSAALGLLILRAQRAAG